MLRCSSGLADAGPSDVQIVWFDALGTTEVGFGGARLFGAVVRVFSHGEVRLPSPDPLDDPIVEFRMRSDERDLVRLRDVVRRMIEIVTRPAAVSIIDEVSALDTPRRPARRDHRVGSAETSML